MDKDPAFSQAHFLQRHFEIFQKVKAQIGLLDLSGQMNVGMPKQKLKRFYGAMERQFRRYFKKASQQKGNVGFNLLTLLERRLDNAVYLSGIASSRAQARQYIRHGFICSDGHRVDIPSYTVSQGQEFQIKTKKDGLKKQVEENLLLAKSRETPGWIDTSKVEKEHTFRISDLPTREQISVPVEEQLVIELCSK